MEFLSGNWAICFFHMHIYVAYPELKTAKINKKDHRHHVFVSFRFVSCPIRLNENFVLQGAFKKF